ncbi:hypothetical protein C1929_12210 [Stenotrophomonas sp. ZAC14D1_NAIMI4_6]|uniref:hypothetical protein n=1 Tax=unclassified Stenotrophomonas maltophilia group TaxID=2961925 RepID=UPI000D53CE8B|nr:MULTISPECIES: hypothetical protein [unclassified Stenotrophomonas maltophilia group]AWH37463.1 hypothetical protein C1929_12210 [Stenotrophomonas sp. ZAC14D1_NAIMI4_6]AWH41653.1 hypothetical protein C1927_12535 [Stenotrophomonas sp. ZAC14D1_NAIMI4_1]
MQRTLWGMIVGWLLAGAVQAQTHVYKCVDGPHPVYQQTPCQGRAEWRWDVPAEAAQPRGSGEVAPSRVARPTQPGRASGRTTRGRSGRSEGALITLERDPAGCQQARREQARKMTRARRLDYQQRRQLDDALRLACQQP